MSRKPDFPYLGPPCLTPGCPRKVVSCGVCRRCKDELDRENRFGISSRAEQIKAGRIKESPVVQQRKRVKDAFFRLVTTAKRKKK